MADVVLFFPHTGATNEDARMLPLAVLTVAAPLDAAGYRVRIIDQRGSDRWQEDLKSELGSPELAMVGISSMTGPQIAGGLKASKIVKELAPQIPVVWGGVHPTLLPDQTISHPLVDIVAAGEGEQTALDLVRALTEKRPLSDVAGIRYKRDGKVVTTRAREFLDLADLPEPAYHLVDVRDYLVAPLRTKEKSLAFITSRGCPFRCGYCYNIQFNARAWRSLPAEEMVRRMKSMKERFGLSGVFLLDDNFFVDKERVRNICKLLIEDRVNLAVHNANCRADTIVKFDEELLSLLKEAGFTQMYIGAESGSPEILKRIDKGCTVDEVLRANQMLKRHGIKPFFSFMAGFPFETVEDVKMTLRVMQRLIDENPDALVYRLQLYMPFPGSELYEECTRHGMEPPPDLEAWSQRSYDRTYAEMLGEERARFIERASIFTLFLDDKLLARPGLKGMLFRLYSKVVRWRAARGFYRMMPEVGLLKLRMRLSRAAGAESS